MDIEETRNAYERATQMDIGTAKDYIDDLKLEIESLRARTDEHREAINRLNDERGAMIREIAGLKRKVRTWRGIADKVFAFHTGCLEGCRRYLLCTCGFEHYRAELTAEMVEANGNG